MTLSPTQVGALSVLRVTGTPNPGDWVGTDGLGNVVWLPPPSDLEYIRRGEQVISVKDPQYGAAGNGTTNDTAAIQAALNAAGAGGTVLLPPGTYVVDGLTIPTRVTLTGNGQGRLRVRSGTTTLHLITLAGFGSQVTGLVVDGNSAGQLPAWPERPAIIRVIGESCRVSDVLIEDAGYVGVTISPQARHTKINSVTLARCGHGYGDLTGFDVRGSYITITDCHVYDHGNGHAFRVANTMEAPTEFVAIDNCIVERSEHNAYTLETGARYVTFSNCQARDVPQAIKGDGTAHHINVIGCLFERITLTTAFNMTNVDHTVVVGTTLKDSAGWIAVGHNSIVSACTVENIGAGATGTIYGIYVRSGAVSDCQLINVNGAAVRVVTRASVTGCTITASGRAGERHTAISAAGATTATITGNTLVNPVDPNNATFVYVNGKASVQGNILDGTALYGVQVGAGADNYIVLGNILLGASTRVRDDANGSNRVVANNI